MKKIIFTLALAFSSVILFAQNGTVTVVDGNPTTTEVGISKNYQFKFNPQPNSNWGATHYIIEWWHVQADVYGNNIQGKIGDFVNSPLVSISGNGETISATTSKTVNIPIIFGNLANRNNKIIVRCSGTYYKQNTSGGYDIVGTFNTDEKTYDVTVYKVNSPTLSLSTPFLDCCNNNVTIKATDYGDANSFNWTVSGGTIASGQGTNTISVTPNNTGSLTTNCIVSRSSGLPNYTATNSKTFNRTSRTITITSSNSAYICQGTGRIFQTDDQCGMTGVVWSAPNCSISSETIVNGKRQVTIIPNSSVVTGSQLSVSAIASFSGGCSANASIQVPVGSPMTTLPEATCYTQNAPCSITATAYNNYLNFTLASSLGSYTPLYSDWEWEKISGNFFFNNNNGTGYNATTRVSQQADIYLTGPNPTDNPLKFRTRVKSECGWGAWTEFVWNDGTTTLVTPPTPPEKYYTIAPNPTGGYSANISLLNPYVVPTTTSPIIVKLYSIYGQELTTTQMYSNTSGVVYIYYYPYNTMWLSISFDNHIETHTIVKY